MLPSLSTPPLTEAQTCREAASPRPRAHKLPGAGTCPALTRGLSCAKCRRRPPSPLPMGCPEPVSHTGLSQLRGAKAFAHGHSVKRGEAGGLDPSLSDCTTPATPDLALPWSGAHRTAPGHPAGAVPTSPHPVRSQTQPGPHFRFPADQSASGGSREGCQESWESPRGREM